MWNKVTGCENSQKVTKGGSVWPFYNVMHETVEYVSKPRSVGKIQKQIQNKELCNNS